MLVLYADFGFPCCHLAGRAVDAVAAADVEVDWCGVEREPRLSTRRHRLDEEELALLAGEPAVKELLFPEENLVSAAPSVVSNTAAAIAGYAEAYGAGVAADVRRVLLAAYWDDRCDIGDPELLRRRLAGPMLRGRSDSDPLRRFGFAVSSNRTPITTDAWRRIHDWRGEWKRLETGALPTLVDDGRTFAGAVPVVRRLAERVRDVGGLDAGFDRQSTDPARYPSVRVRPLGQWVSMVGGQWASAWKDS